jgi:hypothetical protein
VAAVVALGVWVTGGLVTDDETVARGLTGLWLLLAGAASVAVAWTRRAVAVPVLVGYSIAAVGLGGFLGYTSTIDQTVDEDVVVAADVTDESDEADAGGGGPENRLLASGDFVAEAHPTEGTASVVDTPDGAFLTLTDFVTDPGPDLKVYWVPSGTDVEDGVDLGALKGNKGDQQYALPGSVDAGDVAGGSVVIWCRAFSVSFGSAALSA